MTNKRKQIKKIIILIHNYKRSFKWQQNVTQILNSNRFCASITRGLTNDATPSAFDAAGNAGQKQVLENSTDATPSAFDAAGISQAL